jgi:hypothetical protein
MPATFHTLIRTGMQLDNLSALGPFLRWLEAQPQHVDLIIWDVWNRLHTADERRPDQMLPILKRVDRIRDELGVANLILHHTRKPATSGPDLASGGQKLRGPSEFWGWAENSMYLSPLAGKGVVRVEPESKDAIVESFKVHLEDLEGEARRWVYDGTVGAREAAGATTRQAIIAALAQGSMNAKAIAAYLSKSERTVKLHLGTLKNDGVVDSLREPGRGGRHLWGLKPEGGADELPF